MFFFDGENDNFIIIDDDVDYPIVAKKALEIKTQKLIKKI